MKLNKLFLGLFCASAALLASCSDDNDYQWAPKTGGNQVYFSNALPSSYNLSKSANTFTVPVSRVDSTAAATYSIALQANELFVTAPASVSFDAGQAVANITLTYNPDTLAYDDFQNATLTITDEANTNPYGYNTYSFKAGIPSPYVSVGKGMITDNFWFEASTKVTIMQNSENKNVFRIMSPFEGLADAAETSLDGNQEPYIQLTILKPGDTFYGVEITQENLVGYTDLNTGYFHSSYEADIYMIYPGRFTSLAAEANFLHNRVLEWQANGLPGRIQLAPYFYMFGVGGWDNTQADGIVIIDFPGYEPKDYSAEIENLGVLTNAEGVSYATINVTLGADAQDVKAVVVSADEDPEEVAAELASGDIEGTQVAEGNNFIPIPEGLTGKLAVVLAVIAKGEAQEVYTSNFEYYGGGKNPWKKLGKGLLTDNFFITMYSPDGKVAFDPETFEVEIEENTDEPGLYRLVNPFAYYADEDMAYVPTNFEINATDPDGVYFGLQATGIDDGDGMTYIASFGGYMLSDYPFAQLKAAGYLGTLSEGVITLPIFQTQSGTNYQGVFVQGSSAYYTGDVGEFKLVLPEAVPAAARAKARANAKAHEFMHRFYGVRTSGKELRTIGKFATIDRTMTIAK